MKEVCKTIFDPGDVVKLKSGSQNMTVARSAETTTHTVWCYDGIFHNRHFLTETLEPVEQ